MAYQQWNHHHYQAIPESRPLLIQPWQQEFGCPIPRPRSFSLGSRPSGTDLMEVSTKRVFNPSAIILPVDSNNNYRYSSPKRSSKSRKCRWAIFFFLLAISSLTILGWWKLRRPTNVVDLPKDNSNPPPPAQQPYHQHQQQPNPQHSAYHPLPPPPAALIPPGTQQQQYYNQQPARQPPQHAPPPSAETHYKQQQYNPHYGQPQQHHAPYYGQQQQQHGAHMQQHSHKPEIGHQHQGEPVPRKSWMMEHADRPAIPNQENDIRNQQYYSRQQQQPQFQQNYQPHVQQPHIQPFQQPHEHIQQPPYMQQQPEQPKVEPVLSRHEERAKARSQARTMNPIKNSTKTQDGDIWEERQNETVKLVESIIGIKLRLEPAQFSYTESVLGSDGTIFITSFEDSEEVTVEIVEEV